MYLAHLDNMVRCNCYEREEGFSTEIFNPFCPCNCACLPVNFLTLKFVSNQSGESRIDCPIASARVFSSQLAFYATFTSLYYSWVNNNEFSGGNGGGSDEKGGKVINVMLCKSDTPTFRQPFHREYNNNAHPIYAKLIRAVIE